MNRNKSFGAVVLAGVLGMSLAMSGCSSNWVDEAEQISAALIPAAANLVALVATVQGRSVSAQDLEVLQNAGTQAAADLQLAQSLIAAYEKADEAARPGILNQIQSALNAGQANLQGILPVLHIKDAATQAKITAVLGILISEVQSLAAVVPLVQGSGSIAAKSQNPHFSQNQGEMGHPSAPASRLPLSAREFIKSYNAVMAAKSGNAPLDSSARGLQVHMHGAAVRWVSGGVLQ